MPVPFSQNPIHVLVERKQDSSVHVRVVYATVVVERIADEGERSAQVLGVVAHW